MKNINGISCLSVNEMAQKLKVSKDHITNWIKEKKFEAISQKGEVYISPNEYNKFTSTHMDEIMEKVMENLWISSLEIQPLVKEQVNARYKTNSKIVLERAEKAVMIMQNIHKEYEPRLDILNDKNGITAAFIIFARIISLLHSIIELLKSTVFSESFILFRPLWEAILLAEYFVVSEGSNENQRTIRRWFTHEETPTPSEVRYYISNKFGMPVKIYNDLYSQYSKPVHHAYNSIMENYSVLSMDGYGKKYEKRYGFDYHKSSYMRDIITLIFAFENLLQPALTAFKLCFFEPLDLTKEEKELIENEIKFYLLETSQRLDKIFNEKE